MLGKNKDTKKIIIYNILGLILIFFGFYLFRFYDETVRITEPSRTGEFYTKNDFFVFYEVKAQRGCDDCNKYDKKRRIKGANPKTFEILNKHYVKDKDRFYVCDWFGTEISNISTRCEKIKDVDSETFEVIDVEYNNYYAKDKNHVYFYGSIIEGADSQSFKNFDIYSAIDKEKVDSVLDKYDVSDINSSYAIDKKYIYYEDNIGRLRIAKEISSEDDIYKYFLEERESFEGEYRIKFMKVKMEAFIGYASFDWDDLFDLFSYIF